MKFFNFSARITLLSFLMVSSIHAHYFSCPGKSYYEQIGNELRSFSAHLKGLYPADWHSLTKSHKITIVVGVALLGAIGYQIYRTWNVQEADSTVTAEIE